MSLLSRGFCTTETTCASTYAPGRVIVAERRVLVRVNTKERHRESPEALGERLDAAWRGTGVDAADVGSHAPFTDADDGETRYAVCWVRGEVWDVLVHGALWVSFSEQGLATPEVFAEADT